MTGPDLCPFEVDATGPKPPDMPALVFSLRLHEGHGCGTDIAYAVSARNADSDLRLCVDKVFSV